ncbi:hypothetical protein PTI98_000862 [Pleurotus ostreatus]|uniref:Fe2OG dioxygenase domain-containing protein n=1 Tax=Pleurotus ostreatus (strain PC15) TaxID=1137138 RepID=A0A067P5M4_PLEO1|nr:hypothetical protein PTI98_000862 [Pleurotus ostreatus]KDQ31186.1 hypothetical protein PLEOSDRAFT_1102167 [Pleurotus ostreatus PC15]
MASSKRSPKQIFESLTAAITKKPPFVHGAVSLPPTSTALYFGATDAGRLDLLSPQKKQLEQLLAACSPATFGMNKEDVLDEEYRKAGKLDAENFAFNFDVMNSEITTQITNVLLQGRSDPTFVPELYKLNVYGKDGFFKPHKDTPRSEVMFGSLVLVLPTPHEGGQLMLRHEGDEWTFDSAEILSEQPSPSIAFIAFFSDVEHEVLPVKSGHRITISYNLYSKMDDPFTKVVHVPSPIQLAVEESLRGVLDSKVLRRGGFIGFGLSHEYPLRAGGRLPSTLKGTDEMVRQACEKLKLRVMITLLYEAGPDDGSFTHVMFLTYPDILAEGELQAEGGQIHEPLLEMRGANPLLVKYTEEDGFDFKKSPTPEEPLEAWCVTPKMKNNVSSLYQAYGNESTTNYLYGRLHLLALVGPVGLRETAKDDKEDP